MIPRLAFVKDVFQLFISQLSITIYRSPVAKIKKLNMNVSSFVDATPLVALSTVLISRMPFVPDKKVCAAVPRLAPVIKADDDKHIPEVLPRFSKELSVYASIVRFAFAIVNEVLTG